jgi:hypothetical protein
LDFRQKLGGLGVTLFTAFNHSEKPGESMSNTRFGWIKMVVTSATAAALIMTLAHRVAFAADGDSPNAVTSTDDPSASPDAKSSGKGITLLNIKGVFTILADFTGACGTEVCSALDTCECRLFASNGIHVNVFGKGTVDIDFNQTLDKSKSVAAGIAGSTCTPFYGTGSVSGPHNVTKARFFASGWSCGQNQLFADSSTFYVIPGTGSGALANARATGSLNSTTDLGANEALYYIAGDLQKKP